MSTVGTCNGNPARAFDYMSVCVYIHVFFCILGNNILNKSRLSRHEHVRLKNKRTYGQTGRSARAAEPASQPTLTDLLHAGWLKICPMPAVNTWVYTRIHAYTSFGHLDISTTSRPNRKCQTAAAQTTVESLQHGSCHSMTQLQTTVLQLAPQHRRFPAFSWSSFAQPHRGRQGREMEHVGEDFHRFTVSTWFQYLSDSQLRSVSRS